MQWIKYIAQGLVETYDTDDVFELCDYLNIEIIEKDLINIESYFYRNEYADEYIFLDKDLHIRKKRHLVAHELGHAILHTELDIAYYNNPLTNRSKIEIQANIFAAELLTANADIKDNTYDGQTDKQLADCLEVAEDVVKYKFAEG